MALADLMKRGFLTSATATVATPATHTTKSNPTVATVAGVAVANLANFNAFPKFTNRNYFVYEKLKQFEFDLVDQEISAGYPAEKLNRVNNMAWEFMQHDGMNFQDAINLAASIVHECPIAVCEKAYEDVHSLYRSIKSSLLSDLDHD